MNLKDSLHVSTTLHQVLKIVLENALASFEIGLRNRSCKRTLRLPRAFSTPARTWPNVNGPRDAHLAVVRKGDAECDEVVVDPVRDVLAQLLFLDAVLVQRRHEVRQGPGHPESDFLEI